MGRERLYHRLCGLDPHRRRARRSHRRQADFHDRVRAVHRSIARLRARAKCGAIDCGALRAGRGGGHPGAEFARAAQPRLCRRQGARTRCRHLGGRRERGADGRSAGRRRPDHAGRLALDLSGQSADRACRPVADLAFCRRDHALSGTRDRLARPGHRDRSARLACRRHHRRRRSRLGQSVGDLRVWRGGAVCRAVRMAGIARAARIFSRASSDSSAGARSTATDQTSATVRSSPVSPIAVRCVMRRY